MTKETEYIIGEIDHLLFCGARPDQISTALNRSQAALEKLTYRAGRPDLAHQFNKKEK